MYRTANQKKDNTEEIAEQSFGLKIVHIKILSFYCSSEFLNIFFSKNLSKIAIFTNDKKSKIFFNISFLIMRFLLLLSVIKFLNSDTGGELVEKYLWH